MGRTSRLNAGAVDIAKLVKTCALLRLAVVAAGCSGLSAPARHGIGRVPEALGGPGASCAQVAYGYPFDTFEGRVGVGVTDTLDLDANLLVVNGFGRVVYATIGGLGVSYEIWRNEFLRLMLSSGASAGSDRSWSIPGDQTKTVVQIGGFVGLDLGIRLSDRFGAYFGNRGQLAGSLEPSGGQANPATAWGYHVFGFHFDLRELYVAVEGGGGYGFNLENSQSAPMVKTPVFYMALGYRSSAPTK